MHHVSIRVSALDHRYNRDDDHQEKDRTYSDTDHDRKVLVNPQYGLAWRTLRSRRPGAGQAQLDQLSAQAP